MNTNIASGAKIDRVWQQAGLEGFPEVASDAPYRQERLRLRFQAAVLRGWTAWELKEYAAAAAAFHAALDLENPDPELQGWMLQHLLERRADYLQAPINGAWPARSLRPDPSAPGGLLEVTLPNRSAEPTYNETTTAALELLHRLLLAEPTRFQQAAPIYFAYHPRVAPLTEMVLAPIAAGSFLMGSPEGEPGRDEWEGPRHRVTLSRPFWIGIYPVTQQQYSALTDDPSRFRGEQRPVENVSWKDADAFCKKLTDAGAAAGILPEGYVFRLPTEAEWEYCCRADTDTATAFGDSLSSRQANFNGNYPYGGADKGPYLEQTSDVGSYPPNAWGLCDMHGNVWEWCLDASDWPPTTRTYEEGVVDPLSTEGPRRVRRGGGWNDDGWGCRSAYRYAIGPGDRYDYLGFRVCLARSPAATERNSQP